jgi:hypothetical protein
VDEGVLVEAGLDGPADEVGRARLRQESEHLPAVDGVDGRLV